MEYESNGGMKNSCWIKVEDADCPQDKDTHLQYDVLCKWGRK